MKKLLSAILLLVLILSSCTAREVEPSSVALSLRDELCPPGRVYFSIAEEGSEHYAPGLVGDIFGGADALPREWALVLGSGLDSVFEIGILVADDGEECLALSELCEERIRLFSLLGRTEESFLVRRGRTVAYGVLPNASAARERVLAALRT